MVTLGCQLTAWWSRLRFSASWNRSRQLGLSSPTAEMMPVSGLAATPGLASGAGYHEECPLLVLDPSDSVVVGWSLLFRQRGCLLACLSRGC